MTSTPAPVTAAPTASTTPTAPELSSRLIGIAYHAVAAIRDRLLAGSGLTFHQSIALKSVGDGLGAAGSVATMTATLKISEADARARLDEIFEAGLAAPGLAALTDAGAALQRRYTDAVADIADRIYGTLPQADREVAARVLATVIARADKELTAM